MVETNWAGNLTYRAVEVREPGSLGELSEVLVGVDETEINARMDYRYPPGAVRRLDDALLASYAQAYVDLHGNAHRVDLLRARLAKLTG